MISPLESRILDRNSESLGVSVRELMENAGAALAEFIEDTTRGKVLFICGSGNNGGDGYAAYRHISDRADICAFREPKTDLCREVSEGIETIPFDSVDLGQYNVLVDCVLGTGPSGRLRPEYADYIEKMNGTDNIIISCDVPTGFGTPEQIIPDATVTFHDMKEGMTVESCGTIVICDIGIPNEASELIGKGDFLRYPVPEPDSHKGQNGRLVIVGGGPYVGAPIMAALASLRAGTDLVTVMTPKASFLPIAAHSPSYMVKCLSGDVLCTDDVDTVVEACSKADALLIGPGLGLFEKTAEAVRMILDLTDVPAVVDADGITCISSNVPKRKNTVYTPHAAELARLIGHSDASDEDVSKLCSEKSCTVLRKGPEDIIYTEGRIRRNRTGSPGMTVGGTGDVLAGTAAGLLAKGMSCFDSACLAAYICGLSGERSFDRQSYGMTAADVIDNIGPVLKEGLE